MFDALFSQLETDLRAALGTCITGLVSMARAQLERAHEDNIDERTKGLADVAEERAKALAEVDMRRAKLGREIAVMHTHQEKQQGRVELNIGGHRFQTSVQTLRRIPHTFFDAYFSGRYAQDVCNDGSIFVDRDGEHFGHVLEYMRDGFVSVAEAGAHPSVSLLRVLKREFGFYCIELNVDIPNRTERPELAYVIGGQGAYSALSDEWSVAAYMFFSRSNFGACVIAGEVYVTGGCDDNADSISMVERYSPSSDTWSIMNCLPETRAHHTAASVDLAMYVLGGNVNGEFGTTASVIKFDSVESTWNEVMPMPDGRSGLTSCVIGSDIFVFGGFDGHHFARSSVFKYDTQNDEWATLADMPYALEGHSSCVLDGIIHITNGQIVGQMSMPASLRFDPVSEVWSTHLPALGHNHYLGVSFVLGGCLYEAGCIRASSQSRAERYDMATDSWKVVAKMNAVRYSLCAVTIGSTGTEKEQDLFDALITKASDGSILALN
jgi:hypothetical protein